MKNFYQPNQSLVSKSVLAGVFTGIVATLAILAYDFGVRMVTQFSPSQIINVATIIFGSMLVCSVCGLIYYWAGYFIKSGEKLYIVVFAALSIFCFWSGMHVVRSTDVKVTADFRILLLGTIAILGILVTFYIPYLMKHTSIFLDDQD